MKKALLLLAAAALAAPATAQHSGHTMPGMTTPAPKKAAPKKKPAAKKVAPKKAATKKAVPKKAAPKKKPATKKPAAAMPAAQADPHAGHQMPANPQPPAVDPHAGHQMPAQPAPPADPHAGHDMGSAAGPEPQPAPPPPDALGGPKHAADAVWGTAAMERGRHILREEHGDIAVGRFLVDRAEARFRNGRDGYLVDIQAWYGGDIDKFWVKSEVEGAWGRKLEHAEVQALWSHAIDPWFDVQAGVRFDPQPGPDRSHLVLGIQGLAPYWWEVEAAVFLSHKGDVTARAEAEYDLRLTQKLILQPRAEVNLALQDVPELGIGAGLSEAALGLRLRYQVSPLVAPYVGVEYERAFGDTRRFLRAESEDPGGLNILAGIRFWF